MFIASLALAVAFQQPSIDYAKSWGSIRSSIESRYYARKSQHERMESLLDKYEPRAKAAKSQAEFDKDVNDMIAEFGDSHFGFFTKSDQGFYVMESLLKQSGTPMPNVGAWFRAVPGGYEIQMLVDGGAAAKAGLRKGDLVTLADGAPFTPIDSLAPKVDHTVKLTYMRNHETLTADVDVSAKNGNEFFLDGTRQSQRIIEFEGKKFGYIHLWTMSNDAEKNALAGAVFGRMKDTDGFILDIRDGFGGRPEGYGDPFFRPEVTLSWDMQGFVNQQLFGYQRPLVVIINKGSRSAKEVFAFIMKTSRRATLVGERTGGNVLGTSPSPVGDWGYLEIPMVDVRANGVRLEKVGVSPDVSVAREFDDAGKDLYLDQALKTLRFQLRAGGRKPGL